MDNKLTDIAPMRQEDIQQLFTLADDYLSAPLIRPILSEHTIANLFFEPSTRTLNSFTLAEKRLGALTLSPSIRQSALKKGESIFDMLKNLEAMGVTCFVIRHQDDGIMNKISSILHPNTALVNAGEGTRAHPSQALLDLFAISRHKPDFKALSVAIVGDIKHSRVARSLIRGLNIMGTTDIRLVAPTELMPEVVPPQASLHNSLENGLKGVDVVVTLRVQTERQNRHMSDKAYYKEYGLTEQRLAYAKPDALVLHPGPINRNVEIQSCVADGPQSLILEQVKGGVAMRMAILSTLLLKKKNRVA